MIRLIQRHLIIPRGDTGSFTIPAIGSMAAADAAIFTIFDTLTHTKVHDIKAVIEDDKLRINFTHNDTVNLKPGNYVWDIKFYKNPVYLDDQLVNGDEIDSYYAGYRLPQCEIRETGDTLLVSSDAPQATLSSTQLDIINAAITAVNNAIQQTQANVEHYPVIRDEEWYVWDAEANDYVNTGVAANGIVGNGIASAVLNDDYTLTLNFTDGTAFTSPSIRGETGNGIDDIVLNNDFTLTITYTDGESYTTPAIRGPVGPTPQFSIGTVQDGTVAAASITGTAENPVLNLTLPNAHVPTQVSQLTNDAGYLTTETDPTVPAWAKTAQKPSYTAAEVGAPTVAEMNTAIGTAIGQVNSFDIAVVQELPTQDISTHTIYLVPKTGETNDVYDEYVYINNAWEMVGNTQIDLSNYVQKTDYATTTDAGVIKVGLNSGLVVTADGSIIVSGSADSTIKPGANARNPITPKYQHTSTFYGLAKAAGDTTQRNSDNAVGTYTDEAKAAIQQMLDVPSTGDIPDTSIYATKADTVLETTLSKGRLANSNIGLASIAFGINVEASGAYSVALGMLSTASANYAKAEGYRTNASGQSAHAEGRRSIASGTNSHAEGTETTASAEASHSEGTSTIASGTGSHSEGYGTLANGCLLHVEGRYNQSATIYSEWTANTEYSIGDKITLNGIGYICIADNSDAEWNKEHWQQIYHNSDRAFIVGNGIADDARSNAYALDWDGDGHYAGDVYVHANADSTGGTKLATIEDVPVQDVQVNGVSVLTDGVANVPIAGTSTLGVVRKSWGVEIAENGALSLSWANSNHIKSGTDSTRVITPARQNESTFYGLAKAAGADMKDIANTTVGTYPDAQKEAIQSMLGISQMLAPENPNLVATQAYAIGDVFAANGHLYKATAAIAQDEAIIPDTNCVETTMVDAGGKIKDVQVNGTSVVGSDGVANVPVATSSSIGLVKGSNNQYGITVTSSGMLTLDGSNSAKIKAGISQYTAINPARQHESVFYGLSKVAGVDLANETVTLGTYPETSKTAIKNMLGVQDGLKVVRLI